MSFEGEAELEELEDLEGRGASRVRDVSTLARRSTLNFLGGGAFGLFTFLWLVVVTRGWGANRAGTLLEAVAFFTIATSLVVLGSEESIVRAVSRELAAGTVRALGRTLVAALVPVGIFAVLASAFMWVIAPDVAHLFGSGSDASNLERYIRMFTLALPFTSLYYAILAATRGLGAMVPTVAIERVGRTSAQAAGAALVISTGGGVTAMALAWEMPFVIGLGFAAWALYALMRKTKAQFPNAPESPPLLQVTREFWRFSSYRGLAAIFQTASLWVDTLIVGALVSASATAIYTTSSRTIKLGSLILLAIIQAMAPQLSDLLSRGQRARAEHVYRVSTWWLMTVTWPVYATMAVFAPLLLHIFGHGFSTGSEVVVTMAAAMLLSTAMGPVDMVLLMGGKSGWNLINTMTSLTANITLNFLLIPQFGIEGAAIAWAVAVALNNILPYIEVRVMLHITPFAAPGLVPALSALVSYGVIGVAARIVLGPTIGALALALALGSGLYFLLLRRFGTRLEFGSLRPGRLAVARQEASRRPAESH